MGAASRAIAAALLTSAATTACVACGRVDSEDLADIEVAGPDAGLDAASATAQEKPEACGIEVGGAVKASVIGTHVASYPAGTEVPFLWFECSGVVGGSTYEVSGQYEGGATVDALWLTTGRDYFASTRPCLATAKANGAAVTGDSYAPGQRLAMKVECADDMVETSKEGEAVVGGRTVAARAWLDTMIVTRP
jgi:hypothetical protein